MDKFKAFQLITDNPAWEKALREGLELQEQKEKELKGFDRDWLGFEWFDVHTQAPQLRQMVASDLMNISMSSRSSTFYKIRYPEVVREALEMIDRGEQVDQVEQENHIPEDLFDIIVSHDKIKNILKKSINASKPVHVLMYGPPATAKSLFLSELSRLPDSKYLLGSSVSKAGLVEYLLEFKPKYLIFDEIEKAAGDDLSTLLSLMESGMVTRLKHKKRETEFLKTWVFASANQIKNLPDELKSRFLTFYVPQYNLNELHAIAQRILADEDIPADTVQYIVAEVSKHSYDIRDILRIARLAEDGSEVDMLIESIWR